MKYLLVLILSCLSTAAMPMSCPNNGSIVDQGDNISEVVSACGEATYQNEHTENIAISKQWVYYKNNTGTTSNSQVSFLFNQGKVANIHLTLSPPGCQTVALQNTTDPNQHTQVIQANCINTEQNVSTTALCGQLIGTGNSEADVLAACGTPAQETVLQSKTVKVVELQYKSSTKPNTLVFEDGILTNWK